MAMKYVRVFMLACKFVQATVLPGTIRIWTNNSYADGGKAYV